MFVEHGYHLAETGDLRIDDVIAEQDGEGFIPHERSGYEDRMPQAERFLLANIAEGS